MKATKELFLLTSDKHHKHLQVKYIIALLDSINFYT